MEEKIGVLEDIAIETIENKMERGKNSNITEDLSCGQLEDA